MVQKFINHTNGCKAIDGYCLKSLDVNFRDIHHGLFKAYLVNGTSAIVVACPIFSASFFEDKHDSKMYLPADVNRRVDQIAIGGDMAHWMKF